MLCKYVHLTLRDRMFCIQLQPEDTEALDVHNHNDTIVQVRAKQYIIVSDRASSSCKMYQTPGALSPSVPLCVIGLLFSSIVHSSHRSCID